MQLKNQHKIHISIFKSQVNIYSMLHVCLCWVCIVCEVNIVNRKYVGVGHGVVMVELYGKTVSDFRVGLMWVSPFKLFELYG